MYEAVSLTAPFFWQEKRDAIGTSGAAEICMPQRALSHLLSWSSIAIPSGPAAFSARTTVNLVKLRDALGTRDRNDGCRSEVTDYPLERPPDALS